MRLSGTFGPPLSWPDQDLIAISEEFDTDLVADAYLAGVFPMPLEGSSLPDHAMGWWSPVHRGILPLDDVRITRSLRQSAKRYVVTVDAAFDEVIARCADPARPSGWIDLRIIAAYRELHLRGIAHSVEAWTPDGVLAGGLYGVSFGGLFAGESMFHDPACGRDASKVALVRLCELLDGPGTRLLDVQWVTDHLASLGAVEIDRVDYLRLLSEALDAPAPDWARARYAEADGRTQAGAGRVRGGGHAGDA